MNSQNTFNFSPDYMDLFACGEKLDAVDAGMEEVEVTTYRDLLKKARSFILQHWGHPRLAKECLRSGALFDLYSYTEYEKRLAPKLALLKDDALVSAYAYTEIVTSMASMVAN